MSLFHFNIYLGICPNNSCLFLRLIYCLFFMFKCRFESLKGGYGKKYSKNTGIRNKNLIAVKMKTTYIIILPHIIGYRLCLWQPN